MRLNYLILLLVIFLASCAKPDESRHKALDILEKPPTVVSDNTATQSLPEDPSTTTEKENVNGLGEDIFLSTSKPPELIIKRPAEVAWTLVGKALKKGDIKITDQERNKGLYYISYDPGGFFGKLTSFITDPTNSEPYLIRLIDEGEKTKIVANQIYAPDSSEVSGKEAAKNKPVDESGQLLKDLYEALQKNMIEKTD
jgi:uncharacterized lipoprotein